MTALDELIRSLARRRPTAPVRYGTPAVLVGTMTLLRFVAPLDVAPFLLYMPVLFVLTVALGWEAGVVAATTSAVAAWWFFVRDDVGRVLAPGEVIALVEYAVVCTVMILICDALRRSMARNEVTLGQLADANSTMAANQAKLHEANDNAEAARLDAEAARCPSSGFLRQLAA